MHCEHLSNRETYATRGHEEILVGIGERWYRTAALPTSDRWHVALSNRETCATGGHEEILVVSGESINSIEFYAYAHPPRFMFAGSRRAAPNPPAQKIRSQKRFLRFWSPTLVAPELFAPTAQIDELTKDRIKNF